MVHSASGLFSGLLSPIKLEMNPGNSINFTSWLEGTEGILYLANQYCRYGGLILNSLLAYIAAISGDCNKTGILFP